MNSHIKSAWSKPELTATIALENSRAPQPSVQTLWGCPHSSTAALSNQQLTQHGVKKESSQPSGNTPHESGKSDRIQSRGEVEAAEEEVLQLETIL
jgi:hypothetical protein